MKQFVVEHVSPWLLYRTLWHAHSALWVLVLEIHSSKIQLWIILPAVQMHKDRNIDHKPPITAEVTMKQLLRISTVMGLLVVLVCYGCAGMPTEQLDRAQKALDQAKEQHAEEFSPNEWRSGMETWKNAQAALDNKRYSEANTYLLKAAGQLQKARDLAKGKRDELLKEIRGLQKTIDIRYQGVKASMGTAKLSPAVKKELEDSIKDIDQGIAKIKTQADSGDYTQAKYTAQTTFRKVYEAEKMLPAKKGS
jgi:hypothetical protein